MKGHRELVCGDSSHSEHNFNLLHPYYPNDDNNIQRVIPECMVSPSYFF